MSYIVIIQARLTSSRFPKKVLAKIKNKTIIEIIYLRLKDSFNLFFAIPDNKKNLELKHYLKKKKYTIHVRTREKCIEEIL